jgi:hypothetical protein
VFQRWICLAFLTALFALVARGVQAEPARNLSPYETQSVQIALDRVGGGQIELSPAGKVIERIDVVTLEVLEPRDPAPQFLNWFHVTTKESVIRSELLFRSGERYDQGRVDESERLLRDREQLSVVLIVALAGKTPAHVRLLVVTKDVWSLRTAWDAQLSQGKPVLLVLQPSETNLFGSHQVLTSNLTFTPNQYWLGGSYRYPRIGGSQINAYVSSNVGFHCVSQELEYASGAFQYGQPLYSADAQWSWQVASTWSRQVIRPKSGVDALGRGMPICSDGKAREFEVEVQVPSAEGTPSRQVQVVFKNQLQLESLRGQAVLTRSFFRENKLNLSTGMEVERQRISRLGLEPERTRMRTPGNDPMDPTGTGLEAVDPVAYALARARLYPSGERRISPYAQVHSYSNRWLRMLNYDSLGLQEDWRMGHDAYLRVYPAFHPLSSHDLVGLFASSSYAWPLAGGFFKVLGGAQLEIGRFREPVANRRSGDSLTEAQWQGGIHWVSPSFVIGRLVTDGSILYRPQRQFLGDLTTGGASRLRGFGDVEFRGAGVVNANVELRSKPLSVFEVNTGLVAFVDSGGALDPPVVDSSVSSVTDDPAERQRFLGGTSVGLGVRILAPQLDREVFRVDFGFPVREGGLGFGWFATFGQAFGSPSAVPQVLLPQ